MDNQEYKEKCAELAALYQEASITGKQFINSNQVSISSPNVTSKLENWSLEENNFLDKYIELGLDMEFSNKEDFGDPGKIHIGKLVEINPYGNSKYYKADSEESFYYCRLRPHRVHWWNRAGDNPIPENALFKIFSISGRWSSYKNADKSKNYAWNKNYHTNIHSILAFSITYERISGNLND